MARRVRLARTNRHGFLLTSLGLCYSVNMLPYHALFPNDTFHGSGQYLNYSSEVGWSLDDGYVSRDYDSYPERLGIGNTTFHYTYWYETKDEYFAEDECNGEQTGGFKILVHNPAVFPDESKGFITVSLNDHVKITATPDLIAPSPGLRHLSPQRRQCYFSDERQLRLFNIYTFENCALECLSNYTLHTCGCVGFFMPRLLGTPVCGPKYEACVQSSAGYLEEKHVKDGRHNSPCDCLPSCTNLEYEAQHSMVALSLPNDHVDEYRTDEYRTVESFEVLPKKRSFYARQRSELYVITNFLANCGGLLGLGLGFSILSVVELFYWIFVRVWTSDK